MENTPRIDIILPVYNEAGNIENTLDSIAGNIVKSKGAFTVSVVYDFDGDDTLPVIERIRKKYPFEIGLVKNERRGVCNAIKKGFEASRGDFCLVTMADSSDDHSILPEMARMAAEGADIICASRYMKGLPMSGAPTVKKLLSRLAGVSLHLLTGIPTHDITNSYKMYNRRMLEKIRVESSGGFEIGMEITAKAFLMGFRIEEIPCRWWDRTSGKSKFRFFAWLPRYMRWYILLLIAWKRR